MYPGKFSEPGLSDQVGFLFISKKYFKGLLLPKAKEMRLFIKDSDFTGNASTPSAAFIPA